MNNVSIHRQLRSAPVRDSSDKPPIGRQGFVGQAGGRQGFVGQAGGDRQDFIG